MKKWANETNAIDQDYQFAYLGRKREEMILTLYEKSKEYQHIIAMDISKAFDKISRLEIRNRLSDLDRDTRIMVEKFAFNRKLRSFENGKLTTMSDEEGL